LNLSSDRLLADDDVRMYVCILCPFNIKNQKLQLNTFILFGVYDYQIQFVLYLRPRGKFCIKVPLLWLEFFCSWLCLCFV
jgi:hypothetical protein